ncbi:expressed unknown protein [Seminavis robusta]|uniref:Uncharacterized protein n=1 Tax=Seminavis robusta TaxID=568900 RepID=A0A9N8E0V7_9STRA|nr:expressed unknown protein [Seminavis robusta]|eukprot:Sro537_g162300.1 n/a (419) ;mRNA; r:14579-15835
MTSDNQFPPIDIVVLNGELACSHMHDDDSVTLCTMDESDSVAHAQYVEISPGNYYEILESRWESEHGALEESGNSRPSASRAPPSAGRPYRRGSLVMTLKKSTMLQEDISRRESVASPKKPTLPSRRESMAMSLATTDEEWEAQGILPQPDNCRQASFGSMVPVRPNRRASIVTSAVQDPEATGRPHIPFRRGSLNVADLGYAPQEAVEPPKSLVRTITQCSEPPKYPHRKSSMGMCQSQDAANAAYALPTSDLRLDAKRPPKRPFRKASMDMGRADDMDTSAAGNCVSQSMNKSCSSQPKCPLRKASMGMCSSQDHQAADEADTSNTEAPAHDVRRHKCRRTSLVPTSSGKELPPHRRGSLVLSLACYEKDPIKCNESGQIRLKLTGLELKGSDLNVYRSGISRVPPNSKDMTSVAA